MSAIRREGNTLRVVADAGEYTARDVVIASGARLRNLGVPGEEQFDHRGVSQCADCDGPMFQGEHVVVAGGGDAAFQGAAALSHYVGKVTVLLRGAAPRARSVLVERVQNLPNVAVRTGVQVEAIHDNDTVNAITLRRSDGQTERMECAGVFVFVGLTPNSEMAPAEVARNAEGAIETDASHQTAVPGVFAAGGERHPSLKIIALTVHRTEEYVRAALDAGANGYMLKDDTHQGLLTSIQSVLKGQTYLSPAVCGHVVNSFLDPQGNVCKTTSWDSLTLREREVIKLNAEGNTNKMIARMLSISVKTVEKHRGNMMKKLDLHSASKITAYAIENRLV